MSALSLSLSPTPWRGGPGGLGIIPEHRGGGSGPRAGRVKLYTGPTACDLGPALHLLGRGFPGLAQGDVEPPPPAPTLRPCSGSLARRDSPKVTPPRPPRPQAPAAGFGVGAGAGRSRGAARADAGPRDAAGTGRGGRRRRRASSFCASAGGSPSRR